MKKILITIVILAAGLSFSVLAAAEDITIVGTGDGVVILDAVGQAFSRENPGVTVNVPKSISSEGGIKAVGKDRKKIGCVARKLKNNEKHFGLSYVPFAKVPTVFFVSKSVEVTELTPQQVCDIYSGRITNWRDVGGKNARIRLVRREEGDSSLRVLLNTLPGFGDITLTPKSRITFSTADSVCLVENTAGAIGFGSYDVVRHANVNILTIGGKEPGQPGYPSNGTLGLIFKEENKTGNIKKFVEFASSSRAHDAIKSAGGIVF